MSQSADIVKLKLVGTCNTEKAPTTKTLPSRIITFDKKEGLHLTLGRIVSWWQKKRFKVISVFGFSTTYYPSFSIEYTEERVAPEWYFDYIIVGEDGNQHRAVEQYRIWKYLKKNTDDIIDVASVGGLCHYIIVFYYKK